jgi:hypothetical protein
MFVQRLSLAVALLLPSMAAAGTLRPEEVAVVQADIQAIYRAFEAGDPELFIAKTHDSLIAASGGQESFEKILRGALTSLKTTGIQFVSSDLGTPTATYPAGDEEVCFVPRVSVMEIQGKRVTSIGFMIAIRKQGESSWKYLDGSGLRKAPEHLYILLPKLERGIELPPNRIEAP